MSDWHIFLAWVGSGAGPKIMVAWFGIVTVCAVFGFLYSTVMPGVWERSDWRTELLDRRKRRVRARRLDKQSRSDHRFQATMEKEQQHE
jgi:hypothetical protein